MKNLLIGRSRVSFLRSRRKTRSTRRNSLGFLFVSLGSRVASNTHTHTHGFNGGRLKRTGATTFSVSLIRKKKNLRIRSLPSCDRATIRAQKRLLEFHKPLKVHSARYFDPRLRLKSLWTGYVMQEYCRSEFRSSPIYQQLPVLAVRLIQPPGWRK